MKKLAALAPMLTLLAAPAVHAADCPLTASRSANVPGGGIKRVVISAGAGDLDIRGEAGGQAVTASGTACASSEQLLGEIRIESRREGDTVYLRAILPDLSSALGALRRASLDLSVRVPKAATVSVEDSSGDLQLHDVAAAVVADSSGDMTVTRIEGELDVTDSSGELSVRNIGGTLRIKDSSGEIHVEDVRGDVVVTVDSSGDMHIERVAGSVHVVNDSSGEIKISEVQHDVTVEVDSSGRIRVERVGGNFTVGADSSGGITYERVLGSVRLPER